METTESIYEGMSPQDANQQLLERAALGDHVAELYLGHLADEISPRDSVAALTWYRRAAAGGVLEAKHWIASFTYHGIGTDQDISTAVDLLRECAEAGLDASQWKLGQHLLQFRESKEEALRWLASAADQGHLGAIELLGEYGERDG